MRAYCRVLLVAAMLLISAGRTRAIGWDNDDFLIGGGPSFTNKIGVFDHDLTFKGLLDPAFVTVGGMDFDAAGHLVAVSFALQEVRVYDPAGAHIGGFIRTDNALSASGDLNVAPDGTYIIGQGNQMGADGARRFSPTGDFLRQYGDGNMARMAIVADTQLWSGRFDSPLIRRFDLETGAEGNPLTVEGLSGVDAITYSDTTNTMLFAHPLLSRLLETDLTGHVIRTFQSPQPTSFNAVTRGPAGDVFATTSTQTILRWRADGTYVESVSVSSTLGNGSSIVWAGIVPEPRSGILAIVATALAGSRLPRRGVRRPA